MTYEQFLRIIPLILGMVALSTIFFFRYLRSRNKRGRGLTVQSALLHERQVIIISISTVVITMASIVISWQLREKFLAASAKSEEEIRKVVEDSQRTLNKLYMQPRNEDHAALMEYWVPAEKGGVEVKQIEGGLRNLAVKGWRYGEESSLEVFEIDSVKVEGDVARVETTERWYLPLYDENNNRVLDRNPFLGPYQTTYILRKIDGEWLIQEETYGRSR